MAAAAAPVIPELGLLLVPDANVPDVIVNVAGVARAEMHVPGTAGVMTLLLVPTAEIPALIARVPGARRPSELEGVDMAMEFAPNTNAQPEVVRRHVNDIFLHVAKRQRWTNRHLADNRTSIMKDIQSAFVECVEEAEIRAAQDDAMDLFLDELDVAQANEILTSPDSISTQRLTLIIQAGLIHYDAQGETWYNHQRYYVFRQLRQLRDAKHVEDIRSGRTAVRVV
jgi:hypothetical protein